MPGLLRQASSGGGSDPDWLAHLADLNDAALPPRDPPVLAPGQEIGGLAAARGMAGGLHPNALGIYAEPRPPPPGDVVLPPGDPRSLAMPWLPRASGDPAGRAGNVMTTPSYLPGPYGSTRIAAGGSLPVYDEATRRFMELLGIAR